MQIDRSSLHVPLALAAALALGSSARAEFQIGKEIKYFEAVNSFDLASMGYAGSQGRIVHGDATGDLAGCMFFLLDGEVLWSPLPYSLTSVAPLTPFGTPASDLAMARNSSGTRDVLLLSNDTGLVAAEYVAATNGFDLSPVAGSSVWAGATQLQRHPPGPSGKTVISGLLSDGVTVRVSEVDELSETHQFSVPVPIEILSYDLIDYDLDGSLDVAFVNIYGLFVFSQQGWLLRREQVELSSGGVATFRSTDVNANGIDRLAFWFVDETTGGAHLRVVDGWVTEPNIELELLPPFSSTTVSALPSYMTVGDYNDDDQQDLMLQLHHSFCVLLTNQDDGSGTPPAEHFDVQNGAYDSIPLGPDPLASSNPGAGLAFFGNIDSDPGDDLLVPLDDANRIEVLTRDGLLNPGPSGGGEQFVGHGFDDLVTLETTYYWDELTGDARLNLALEIPAQYLPGGAEAFEYLQIATWFQDGLTHQLQLVGEQNSLHALQAGTPFQWTEVLPLEQGTVLPGDFWPERDNMWVVLRFVDANVTQQPFQIERASRFSIGAFTLREDPGTLSVPPYLTTLAGAGATVGLYHHDGPYDSLGGEQSFNGPGPKGTTGKQKGSGNAFGQAGHSGATFGGGPTTSNFGGGYVGAYVPQSASVLFPPGDVPFFPGLSSGNGLGHY